MPEKIKQMMRMILRKVSSSPITSIPLLGLSHLNLLPEFLYKRLPVERSFVVRLWDELSFVYESSYSDMIGRELFWQPSRSFEFETIPVFHEMAKRSRVVLDIGANTGIYSLIACAANPFVQVIAFEPVPHVRERLSRNIRLNAWENRCCVRSEAVSNYVGHTQLYVPHGDLPYVARLDLNGFTEAKGRLIETPVITVDAVCAGEYKVDLVKIDVEGAEDRVLEGMQTVLQDCAPAIICECNPEGPVERIQEILTPLGYEFFQLRPGGPVKVHTILPDQQYRYRNTLCLVRK